MSLSTDKHLEASGERFSGGGGPIEWMTRNTVAANILMVILVIGGLVIGSQVKQEVFPELDLEWIIVQVPYPGATPEEVEQGLLLSIEESVRGIDGVKRVVASASESVGAVYIEMLLSADGDKVLADVKNAVDRIQSFPAEAERPIVSQMSSKQQVMQVALYGDQDDRVLKELAEQLRDRLLQSDGVTQVELGATRATEISVEVDTETLRRYNLTLPQIAQKVRSTAVQLSAGVVKAKGGEVLLRTNERRERGIDFEDVAIVESPTGTRVTLGELGVVRDGFADEEKFAQYDGKPAVVVKAFRVGDETPVSVADATREVLESFRATLPPGVGVAIVRDQSLIFQDRMNLLLRNAFWGLIFVLLILGLFLKPSLAFWVTLGIPISFCGALLLMPLWGVSINMISLFAFIVTTGIVVDDAIVVGENIYEYRRRGLPPMKAAIAGAREVAMPVTFSIATTVAAFSPMLFVPGFSGQLFGVIPAIVISVLVLSLVESLFVLPAHLAHDFQMPRRGILRWVLRGVGVVMTLLKPVGWIFEQARTLFSGTLQWFIDKPYRQLLTVSLRWRYLTFAVGIATMALTIGYIAGGHIDFSFMPKIEGDRVVGRALLPFGTPREKTEEVQKRMIEAAKEVLDSHGGQAVYKGIYAQLGYGIPGGGPVSQSREQPGAHLTSVQIRLVDSGSRGFSAEQFTNEWRDAIGEIAGMDSLSFKSNLGGDAGAAIDFQLSHRDERTLHEAAEALAAELGSYAGVKDIDAGFSAGKPRLDFQLTPEGRSLGLTTIDVAQQVRAAFFGAQALRQQRGRDELRVYVRLPAHERKSLHTIEELLVRTPMGAEVPLGIAATVTSGRADTEIKRVDGRRVVNVTSDVDRNVTNAEKVVKQFREDSMPLIERRFPGLSWTIEGERREQAETLKSLGLGYLIALIVILAMLAIPFRSYIFQPLVVMTAIPFGLVGALIGHIIMGFELSVISMMGCVALSGVVVNDSLVLVVATNRFRDSGMGPFDAIRAACIRRFRPILLTSLTTFFGLMPMIFETSVQARFLIPMAVSLGYGVLFVTFIVLGLLPSLYLISEDVLYLLGMSAEPVGDGSAAEVAADELLGVLEAEVADSGSDTLDDLMPVPGAPRR